MLLFSPFPFVFNFLSVETFSPPFFFNRPKLLNCTSPAIPLSLVLKCYISETDTL